MSEQLIRLDKETGVTAELATQVSTLFQTNYPNTHGDDEKLRDIEKRGSKENIEVLLQDRVVYLLIDTNQKVLALLELKEQPVDGGIYLILSWLIVDKSIQGQGLARRLHGVFEKGAF